MKSIVSEYFKDIYGRYMEPDIFFKDQPTSINGHGGAASGIDGSGEHESVEMPAISLGLQGHEMGVPRGYPQFSSIWTGFSTIFGDKQFDSWIDDDFDNPFWGSILSNHHMWMG